MIGRNLVRATIHSAALHGLKVTSSMTQESVTLVSSYLAPKEREVLGLAKEYFTADTHPQVRDTRTKSC